MRSKTMTIDQTPNEFFERHAMGMASDLAVVYRSLINEIHDILNVSAANYWTPEQTLEKIFELIDGDREPESVPESLGETT